MISRNSSGPLSPKVGIENICASLNQKDKIIIILEKELQSFKSLRENYDRLKDRKNQLMDKCQSLAREISINRGNQDLRTEHNQKYILQLKMIITNLQNQLQNKQYQLKELKCSAESLIKSSEQRQNNLLQSGQSIQQIKSSMQILKMESERLCNQISQLKDEIQRLRVYQNQTQSAKQKIKNQIHNTQGFIRQLGYEESKLTENLSTLQDQNNSIDEIIEDLKKVYEMTKLKMKDVKEERQDIIIKIKTKQSQKGRIQAEYNEGLKLFKAEREKEKNLKQVSEAKKSQTQRLAAVLKEVNQETDELMQNNMQVEDINIQLQKDLHTCCKHLENVNKNNAIIREKLDMFYKINVSAIKKLRKPVDEGWSDLNAKKEIEMETTGEGFLEKSA